MASAGQKPLHLVAEAPSPRILFVLGKGGVGRSTVATALGLHWARRGARVLVLQWAIDDTIGPWFGHEPAGAAPLTVAPRLAVANFSLAEALRAYFVDHLNAGWVYRRVIRARPVQRLIEVAPGIAEMFFVGQLWWLTNLAATEAGLEFDRIVVDAPATGHGGSLLDVPRTMATVRGSGMFALETERVTTMMADPEQVGALLVSLPEALVVHETRELLDRVTVGLGRPPVALLVNRSAATIAAASDHPPWLLELAEYLRPSTRQLVVGVHRELRRRSEVERDLRAACRDTTRHGVDAFVELPGRAPLEVVSALAEQLDVAS